MAKSNLSISQQLVDEVKAQLGGAYQVLEQRVLKTNISLTGIVIRELGEDASNISPQIYVDDYIRRIEEDGEDVAIVAKELIGTYQSHRIAENFDASWFLDYSKVQEKICAKLINTSLNEELLADVPAIPFNDLSIVFYVLVSVGEAETGSILIHNAHMEAWNVDVETIAKKAMENTPKLLGCEIRGMFEIIREHMGIDFPEEMLPEDDLMSVLSTSSKMNGSILMAYTDILDQFIADKERLDGKEYDKVIILPSSTHEVILIAKSDDVELDAMNLADMITSVNDECVSPSEVLSNHPYLYDKHTHSVTSIGYQNQ